MEFWAQSLFCRGVLSEARRRQKDQGQQGTNAVAAVHWCHFLSDTASNKQLPQCSTGNELVIGRRRANLVGTYCLRGDVTGFPGGCSRHDSARDGASALVFDPLLCSSRLRGYIRVSKPDRWRLVRSYQAPNRR